MLTKSDLQSFRQCPRKLWLEKHRPELAEEQDSSSLRRARDGNEVGDVARKQLGPDITWPRTEADVALADAAAAAMALIGEAPDRPAVEFPAAHNGLYARADILLPTPAGYVVREVKASTFPLKNDKATPGNPEDHHVDDLAIQVATLEGAGIKVARAELGLLDNRWRYGGDGDYSKLFKPLDVTAVVNQRKAEVEKWLAAAKQTLAGEMPAAVTGKQCSEPHGCPFVEYCTPLDPPGEAHPIELLPDLAGKNLAKKLRANHGYKSLLEPKPEELTGTNAALYQRIQAAHRTGDAIIVPGGADHMAGFPYPRYYFDFEGIDLPVPRWQGVRSYEQIPFQWSCHIERREGVFEHGEFLDLSGDDPSVRCIQRMLEVIDPGDDGPIFVYYATYERGRLQELAERHPEYAAPIETYIKRLVDLLPIVRDRFYHPAMRGSFSIKKVLPVIAPDLDYEALQGVQEGTGAQTAFLEAAFDQVSPERKREIEESLRVYCRQDTWAMVEVAHFLAEKRRPPRPPGM